MTTSSYHERTIFEARLDIKYCIRLNTLLQRFYQRLGSLFLFCELIGGSVAFSAFLSQHQGLAGNIGLFIAISALCNIVIKPTEKAMMADELRRQYQKLLPLTENMQLSEIDSCIYELRQSPAPDIEGLRNVAHNDNLLENGLPWHCIKESFSNKVCRLLF